MRYKDVKERELVELWNEFHDKNQGYPRISKCFYCNLWSYRYVDNKGCGVCGSLSSLS